MSKVLEIEISKIKLNPWQPRKDFSQQKLEELASSIRTHGIIHPLIVIQKSENEYQLIAGQRRLEAAKMIGLEKVPVIIRDSKQDQEELELALIENLQREDLNPIERAKAYQMLQKKFGLTQNEIAQRIGKARPTIANSLRLLNLPEEIKEAIFEERISEGQAKIILSFETPEKQLEIFRKVVQRGLSVRETERKIRPYLQIKKSDEKPEIRNLFLEEKENELREKLGTKVEIRKQKEKGEIIINFYSDEELEEIVNKIFRGEAREDN
jgi:ParB family chromosome partitioning protein